MKLSRDLEFKFEFDSDGYKYNSRKKKGKGMSKTGKCRMLVWDDIREVRVNPTDLELTIVTPDGNPHKRFITRDSLARMQTFRLVMPRHTDELDFMVKNT